MSRMACCSRTFAVGHSRSSAARGLRPIIALLVWLGEWSGPAAWALLPPDVISAPITRLAADGPAPRSPENPDDAEARHDSLTIDPGTDAAALLLPDLQTLPPSDFEIRLSGSRRILRLANTVWNSGQGALELMGELNPVTRRTKVRQRVYAADGARYDRFVGEFVWHPGHDHWHFEDFAVYQLWSLTPAGELDRIVASSAKLSYCLIDTDVVAPEHPGYAARRRYRGCGRTLQGLSVGWGDKYDSFLDGQSLDLSGLTDGLYGLVSTTNPNASLVEADYTNNVAIVYLKIVGDGVHVKPSPELDEKRCRADGWC